MARGDKMSQRQKAILDYVWEYWHESRRPPTIREIAGAVDISSTSVVNYNLNKLEEKGFLEREAEVSRGLKLTEKAYELHGVARSVVEGVRNMVRVPLMGDIVAGEPVEIGNDDFATYDEEDAIEISPDLISGRGEDKLFALRVRGNSMIDAMVNDNDIVIMEHTTEAKNGDMIAAWLPLDGEMTLKYFYLEEEQVRLQPANPTMEPIYVHPANIKVQGKVMMVMRQTA